jgi:hypothetical protein
MYIPTYFRHSDYRARKPFSFNFAVSFHTISFDLDLQVKPLFLTGPRQVGLLLEKSARIKIIDFDVDERSEVMVEMDILKQAQVRLPFFFFFFFLTKYCILFTV